MEGLNHNGAFISLCPHVLPQMGELLIINNELLTVNLRWLFGQRVGVISTGSHLVFT